MLLLLDQCVQCIVSAHEYFMSIFHVCGFSYRPLDPEGLKVGQDQLFPSEIPSLPNVEKLSGGEKPD